MTILQIPDDKLKKMIQVLEKKEENSIFLKDWFSIRNKIKYLKRMLDERTKHSSH
jgi:hypothetical protein